MNMAACQEYIALTIMHALFSKRFMNIAACQEYIALILMRTQLSKLPPD